MSNFGSPPPPGTKPPANATFEETIAHYGFEVDGFEQISSSAVNGTGQTMKREDFLETLEGGKPGDGNNSEQIRPSSVGRSRKDSTQLRRIGVMLVIMAIAGTGAAVGVLTGSGVEVAAVADIPTVSPTQTSRPTRSPITPPPTRTAPTPQTPTGTSEPTREPTNELTRRPTPDPTSFPTRRPTNAVTGQPASPTTPAPTPLPTKRALTNREMRDLMSSRLKLFFGWRDRCPRCTDGPSKYATVFGDSCFINGGVDSSCVKADRRTYAGIGVDGRINHDDRFYLNLSATSLDCGFITERACNLGDPTQRAVYALGFLCVSIGWRDRCEGCTDPPLKLAEWCVNPALDTRVEGTDSQAGSINTDGNVDKLDHFYISAYIHRTAPRDLPLLNYAASKCSVSLGWRPDCQSCNLGPKNKGTVFFSGRCTEASGGKSRCVGSYSSINTDAVVTDTSKFYAALTCSL